MANLPVTVIGGYLGAGKTSLVNHLLRHAGGRKLAVLVNEFGELAIDADLIEAEEDGLISIAGGCICCSFGDDLIGAMQELAKMDPQPDHIVIESSGVAIPGAIVATMSLIDGFYSDGTVVVLDAETVRRNAADDYIGDTITRQLADAEIVVINKTDLVSAETRKGIETWLDEVAPNAARVPATRGRVAVGAVLGAVATPGSGQSAGHSDRLFESFVLIPADGSDLEKLAQELATGPYGIVRAKGYASGPDKHLHLLHTVGTRWEVTPARGDHETGIICIGFRGRIDKPAVEALDLSRN